ncbi:hypothetical protein FA15DRAFT_674857 [Coprinopsis marcescibilis]|uniref:Endoplasmic reticulum-based factor for assembly of V-ATPase n=1 Tax=Coprinopsis marcescibilis TaxID=230819 RepID=A0A5C3KFQ9_COPMA|nr:hypothetical protein FA15DRAFT_674857 [Coprinopsis marcescibilis]
MTSISTALELNVSLEQHLLQRLRSVQALLPAKLATETATYVVEESKPNIPHRLLREISQWSRSEAGAKALRSKSMDQGDFHMISLLAGTTTSPESKLGVYVPPKDPEEVAFDRAKERKAITALVNGLFSVFGAGFAAWWGADKTGWKDEWKVLFALLVGFVVASSEALLYVIWSSRNAKSDKLKGRRLVPPSRDKKLDGDVDGGMAQEEETNVILTSSTDVPPVQLRQRKDPTAQ